jgi:hypothetical protein
MPFLPCPLDEMVLALWPHLEVWCTSCRAACRCVVARLAGSGG